MPKKSPREIRDTDIAKVIGEAFKESGLTKKAVAKRMDVPLQKVNEILHPKNFENAYVSEILRFFRVCGYDANFELVFPD